MFMCVVNQKSVNKLDLTWKQSFLIIGSKRHICYTKKLNKFVKASAVCVCVITNVVVKQWLIVSQLVNKRQLSNLMLLLIKRSAACSVKRHSAKE